MTRNRTTSLVKSSFAKIKKDGDIYRIINKVTGKQFAVDANAIEVINSFNTPKVLEDANFSEGVLNSIRYLVNNGVLVSAGNKIAALNHRQLTAHTLFGVKEYRENQEDKNVVFTGVPFGAGNPVSSETKKFPDFFRLFMEKKLSLTPGRTINPQILNSGIPMDRLNKLIQQGALSDAGNIFVHGFETRKAVYSKITKLFNEIVSKDHIPFTIGGDHSISYPIIKSIAAHHDNFNVLHFDAHTDVYGSSFDEILDLNDLHHHGNFVSKCLELPQLNHYYQFGIRGLSNAYTQTSPANLTSIWSNEVKEINTGIRQIALPENEKYYITFDIDVLDPLIAPGTGTPEPNGLFFDDIIHLFKRLDLANKNIIGIDFVEVNPSRDQNNSTTLIAAQIMLNLLNFINID